MAAHAIGIAPPVFWQMTMWELGACFAARVDMAGGERLQRPDELSAALDLVAVEVPK